jgi:hypothetical protein
MGKMPKKRHRRAKPGKKKSVNARAPESLLKYSIRRHFTRLGFIKAEDGSLVLPGVEKPTIRTLHAQQRAERLGESAEFLARALPKALPSFANGSEIDPAKIQLRLIRVRSGTKESDLFRIASLTWSVPVSVGYGRRLRYLVWDNHHQRLVGLIALGDPVFNLSVRDNLIGWDAATRSKRLVRMLDAYVLGAVPPYNMLLCGKAVACLVRSREVFEDFRKTYGGTVGIISKKQKRANLLAVTTTSSMGRSSVYNRLTLGGQKYLQPIGYTIGWGHFHITDRLFAAIRRYLRLKKDPYASNHRFGQGPNWRFRTIRRGLDVLNVGQSVLRHGIQREVFICPYGANALDILKSGKGKLDTSTLLTVREISDLARERWIVPRAARRPEYKAWDRRSIPDLINGVVAPAVRSKSKVA